MKRLASLCCMTVSLLAQNATPVPPKPPEPPFFERLDIVYRMEPGPRFTEIRSGELRLGRRKELYLQRFNDAGEMQVRDLTRIRRGMAEKLDVPVDKDSGAFVWEIAGAEADDVIRFTVEQPMDFLKLGGAWMWSSAPLGYPPILKGTLRLELPTGFTGTVAADPLPTTPGRYEWNLSNEAKADPQIEIHSFKSWGEVSSWMLSQCPARGGPKVREFALAAAAGADTPAAKVRAVVKALDERLSLGYAEAIICRPVEDAITAEGVNEQEVGAVFEAAMAALEFPAQRFLVAPKVPEGILLNSADGALMRVRAGKDELWFDIGSLYLEGGLQLKEGTEAVLPLLATGAEWSAPLVTLPGVQLDPGGFDARLNASFSALGKLQGGMTLNGRGPSAYTSPTEAGKLGTLTPGPNDTYRLEKDYFLVPVEIRTKSPLALTQLMQESVRLPGGGLFLGAPGTYREEIRLEIPRDRRVKTNVDINVDRSFARYQSRARVEGSTLVITREFELRRAYVPAEEVTSALALADRIREDRETQFEFQRLGGVDWAKWVETVPPGALNSMAYRAMVSFEWEGAQAVLERAVKVRPNDGYPWRLKTDLHQRLSQPALAFAAMEAGVKAEPNRARPANYQSFLMQNGRGGEVEQEAREQLTRDPNNVEASILLVNVLLTQKRWTDAEELLMRVQNLPGFPAAARASTVLTLTTVRICGDTALDPASELRAVMGNPLTGVSAIARLVVECKKGLDLVEPYCQQYIRITESVLSGLNPPRLDNLGLNQSVLASSLGLCGTAMILRGEVEPGRERLRAAAQLESSSTAWKRLALHLWEYQLREEAEKAWIQAVSRDPELLSQVPSEIKENVAATPSVLDFPGFYKLSDPPAALTQLVPAGETFYFLARTNEKGAVSRMIDLSYDMDPAVQRALSGIAFDQVSVDDQLIPTVHMVMVQNIHGKVEVLHATSGPAYTMVMNRARPGVIVPQPAQQLQPLAR